jgi:hypothetical protein
MFVALHGSKRRNTSMKNAGSKTGSGSKIANQN